MKCRICNEEYYLQTMYEPEEPCLCGAMSDVNAWEYDKWRGLYRWCLIRLLSVACRLSEWVYVKLEVLNKEV